MQEERDRYTVWIEAEKWIPGSWVPDDSNTDVIITREDGSRWVASFFSYRNIQTLTDKNKRTGECLAGAYFWSTDMILIDEISRSRIIQVVRDLMLQDDFETVFTRLPDPD